MTELGASMFQGKRRAKSIPPPDKLHEKLRDKSHKQMLAREIVAHQERLRREQTLERREKKSMEREDKDSTKAKQERRPQTAEEKAAEKQRFKAMPKLQVDAPVDVEDIRFTQNSISYDFKEPHKFGTVKTLYDQLRNLEVDSRDMTKAKRLQCLQFEGRWYSCMNRRLCALKEYSRYLKKKAMKGQLTSQEQRRYPGGKVKVYIESVKEGKKCDHPITCVREDCETVQIRGSDPNKYMGSCPTPLHPDMVRKVPSPVLRRSNTGVQESLSDSESTTESDLSPLESSDVFTESD